MMTIEEMKERKKELMYTCAMIAEKSGLPLSTVQKVFSGATTKPHFATMEALDLVLKKPFYEYEEWMDDAGSVKESSPAYKETPSPVIRDVRKVDSWLGKESSERWPKQGEYTIDDYYAAPDDMRIELIDGVIYDMGSPGKPHQRMLGYLFTEFNICIEEHGGPCEVIMAPLDVKLDRDDRTVVQPDIQIMCHRGKDENRFNGENIEGPPDLVTEILSPSTRNKDCTIKLRKYMNAGVREYWIVDLKNEKVMVYLFEEDVLPTQYSFDDVIPVGISGGACSIDMSKLKAKLKKNNELFGI